MLMTPVPTAPIPPAPAPVPATPMTVAPVATAPIDILDFGFFNILRRCNSRFGLGFRIWRLFRQCRRHRRHRLCRGCGDNGGHAQSDLQEVSSFHVQSLLIASQQSASLLRDERPLN